MLKKTSLVSFVVFLLAALAPLANAQCFGGGELSRILAGPCAERMFREAYTPVDFALGQVSQYAGYGYPTGYGYGSSRTATIATGAVTGMAAGAGIGAAVGHDTQSALIGAGTGAAVGGLLTYAVTRNRYNQPTYTTTPDGRQVIFTESKRQKPLDCHKINNKNRAACDAAAAEIANQRQVAERQVCLNQLSSSYWRLRNGSDRFTFYPMIEGKPMTLCGEEVALRPLQTIRIFPPNGQISGKSFGASASGETKEFGADVQPVNQPGFIGFVLLAPGVPGREE